MNSESGLLYSAIYYLLIYSLFYRIDKFKESLQSVTEDESTQMSTEPAPEDGDNSIKASQKEMVVENEGENNEDSMVVQEKGDATDEKFVCYLNSDINLFILSFISPLGRLIVLLESKRIQFVSFH